MNETKKGKALAKHIGERMFQAHRGAFAHRDELVAFGNDGYSKDPRARREVDAVIAWGKENGLEVSDFGTHHGYTWVVVFRRGPQRFRLDEFSRLACLAEDVLWRAWHGTDNPTALQRTFEAVQRGQTMAALERVPA